MKQQESRIETLRRRATESLENSKYPMEAESLLERLVEVALDGSDDAIFAHRRLAELRLERSPWKAALHLRKVIRHSPDDHAPHALMGLCQGLLENSRMAVSSYERAVRLAPRIAEYRHNLGHFLDIGLGRSEEAIPHLIAAREGAPENAEITASLAHALARAGHEVEALRMAAEASRLDPTSRKHAALASWISGGGEGPKPVLPELPPKEPSPWDEVETRLREDADRPVDAIRQCRDFAASETTWTNPRAFAAAFDYLTGGESQKVVAARHGVAVSTLRTRVTVVRSVLEQDAP